MEKDRGAQRDKKGRFLGVLVKIEAARILWWVKEKMGVAGRVRKDLCAVQGLFLQGELEYAIQTKDMCTVAAMVLSDDTVFRCFEDGR